MIIIVYAFSECQRNEKYFQMAIIFPHRMWENEKYDIVNGLLTMYTPHHHPSYKNHQVQDVYSLDIHCVCIPWKEPPQYTHTQIQPKYVFLSPKIREVDRLIMISPILECVKRIPYSMH